MSPLASGAATLSKGWICAIAILIAVHIGAILYFLPPRTIASGDPVVYGDWPIKFTEAFIVGQAGELPLKTWVYSPQHLAGYPAGVYTGVGTQSYDLFLLATRNWLKPGVAFNLFLFLMFLLPPFLIPLATWLGGFAGRTCCVAIALSLVCWHLESHISFMWSFGTTAFLSGSAMAVCAAVLYARMLNPCGRTSTVRRICQSVGVGLMAAATTTFHPLCAFVLASLVLWPLLQSVARFRVADLLLHLPAAGLFALLNIHWLLPFLNLKEVYAGGAPGPFPTGIKYLLFDVMNDRSFGHAFDSTIVLQSINFLAIIGLVHWPAGCRLDRRQFIVGLVPILAIGYGGSYVSFLAQLQPYRFVAAGLIVAAIPACVGIEVIARQLMSEVRLTFLVATFAIVLIGPRLVSPLMDRLTQRPLKTLTVEEGQFFEWCNRSTDSHSRIMFAPELDSLANRLPNYLRRETIGGPFDHVPIATRYCMLGKRSAADSDFSWFGKKESELREAEVEERLRLLNVEWLVVRAGGYWDLFAKRYPGVFKAQTTFDSLAVYRNQKCDRSFFLEGDGVAEAAANEIRLSNLTPGRVTIKYHFLSTLHSSPALPIEKSIMLGDQVGWISFDNPGYKDLIISNGY